MLSVSAVLTDMVISKLPLRFSRLILTISSSVIRITSSSARNSPFIARILRAILTSPLLIRLRIEISRLLWAVSTPVIPLEVLPKELPDIPSVNDLIPDKASTSLFNIISILKVELGNSGN